MAENFFLDNLDLQFRLERLDLREVVEIKEKGYSTVNQYPAAPRNYEDAKDNYRLLLEVLGDICASVVAPHAAEADEEGAQFHNGEVEYAAATQKAIQALKQAELMGVMLPWEYGGHEHARDALPDDGGDPFAGRSRPDDDLWLAGDCLLDQRVWQRRDESPRPAPLQPRRSGRRDGADRTGCRVGPGFGADARHL